jgi:hypothetical protein
VHTYTYSYSYSYSYVHANVNPDWHAASDANPDAHSNT